MMAAAARCSGKRCEASAAPATVSEKFLHAMPLPVRRREGGGNGRETVLLASPETGLEAFSTNETSGMTSGRFHMPFRIAALLLALASTAHAQEVVVNATRFPQDVSRLPASATGITE